MPPSLQAGVRALVRGRTAPVVVRLDRSARDEARRGGGRIAVRADERTAHSHQSAGSRRGRERPRPATRRAAARLLSSVGQRSGWMPTLYGLA